MASACRRLATDPCLRVTAIAAFTTSSLRRCERLASASVDAVRVSTARPHASAASSTRAASSLLTSRGLVPQVSTLRVLTFGQIPQRWWGYSSAAMAKDSQLARKGAFSATPANSAISRPQTNALSRIHSSTVRVSILTPPWVSGDFLPNLWAKTSSRYFEAVTAISAAPDNLALSQRFRW